jgi:abequosyltransferase
VRGGIDADLASCVALAGGTYCWLFSGDDVMRPGALERAKETIRSGHDVYVCQHTECDIDMVFRRNHPVLAPAEAYTAEWSDPGARQEWFRRAVNTEAFFSFLSGLLIRRTKWLAGRLIPEFDGSCWAHVARLFEVSPSGLSVEFVPEVWLDRRGDNDSFREKGMVDRLRLAIEGFQRMGDDFFSPDNVEAFHIRRVLRTEFTLRMFLIQKLTTAEPALRSERQLLDRIVRATYRDRSVENIAKEAIYRWAPSWSVRWAITLRRYVAGAARRRT